MSKPKRDVRITPKGVAVWPRLNEPDTKYKDEGEYTVKLAFDTDDKEARKLIVDLEKIRDEQYAQWKSENPKKAKTATLGPVYTDELDDDGEETGRILLNFKMKASGVSKKTGKKWTRKPDIFPAKGKDPLKNPPSIGGGSVLRVSFEYFTTFVESSKTFYLSLRMNAVKLIELVEFGKKDAKGHGFEDEDGYEGSTSDFDDDDDDSDEKSEDSDDDDDGDY